MKRIIFLLTIILAMIIARCETQEKCNKNYQATNNADSLWNAIRENAKVKTDARYGTWTGDSLNQGVTRILVQNKIRKGEYSDIPIYIEDSAEQVECGIIIPTDTVSFSDSSTWMEWKDSTGNGLITSGKVKIYANVIAYSDTVLWMKSEQRTDTIHCAVMYADKKGIVHWDTLYCIKSGLYNNAFCSSWTNVIEKWFTKKWKPVKVCAVLRFQDLDERSRFYY